MSLPLPETGISEIDHPESHHPRRRGRPTQFDEPRVTTTMRVSMKDWSWVKARPGLQFSALLRAKIHELQLDDQAGPIARFIRESRKVGLTDADIAPLLKLIQERKST